MELPTKDVQRTITVFNSYYMCKSSILYQYVFVHIVVIS